MNKNEELAESFNKFCKENPDLRFWQALKVWSGFGYILVANQDQDVPQDTFHFEDKNA